MYKIMIVEDDVTIAEILKKHLTQWESDVLLVTDFNSVLDDFLSYSPQLVLLDISLPFYNGYHWCTQIRKLSKVPIIFISSASDSMNLIMAIQMGADDFIAKPFDLNVAIAKIQALVRRTYEFGGQVNLIEHNGAILSLGDATLSFRENKIDLTKNEFKILQVLLENKGQTISRDLLMKRLWESDSFIDDNTLTVNIARLRKKLELIGLGGLIQTKKGLGYFVKE